MEYYIESKMPTLSFASIVSSKTLTTFFNNFPNDRIEMISPKSTAKTTSFPSIGVTVSTYQGLKKKYT